MLIRTSKSFGVSLISMRNFFAGESGEQNHSHEFGEFRFDAKKRVLWRNGDLVYLPPKSADLLVALLERRGEVLERGDLIDRVWKDTFVEEGNLSYTVSRLRKVLGSNGNGEDFIQTIPRRGYRFVNEPRANGEADLIYEKHSVTETVVEEFHISDATESNGKTSSLRSHARGPIITRTRLVALALVFGTAVIASGLAWKFSSPPRHDTAGIRSIAVLPFRNVGAADNEHRGLGIADLLITRLSALGKINVRPTSAVMSFENESIDSAKAARSLGVDAVLEGTIYRSGDQVRITARLIGSDQQSPIWTAELERPVADELHLQDEIARRLVAALFVQLTPAEQIVVTKRYTDNAHAHRFYMEGRYHWNKRNYEGLSNARYLFQKAIEADPKFALAYVGLADSMVFVDRSPEINSALSKALELDPTLGETFATLGINRALNEWDWKGAEECLKRSIELNPGYATAHQWYAVLLEIQGRNEEAKAEMQRAIEIDPSSYNYLADLGQIYYFDRDYATAKEYCEKALAINPDFAFAHGYLAQIYFRTGEYELAVHEQETADLLSFTTSNQAAGSPDTRKAELSVYSEGYRKGGLKGYWNAWRSYVEKNGSDGNPNTFYLRARMYASLGDREKALSNLEQAVDHKPFLMSWVKADPVFDAIRSDVRFQEILRKMELS